MTSTTLVARPPMTRDEVGTLVGRTMGLVAVTAAAFAVGAYLGRNFSDGSSWLLLVAAFAVLFGIDTVAQRSANLAVAMLFGFGVLVGLSLAPTLSYYGNTDPATLWQTGAATALFVAGSGAAGYATRRDLSAVARYFFWALVALIVFGVVLIFVQIPGGALIYSLLGLVIFAGLTAFDFQRLRQSKDVRDAPLLAVSIFLDILNVFTLMLSLFGGDS
ncbi:MAG: Bax inhibitor-1 family protein [Acidimicrobiales bacterium]